MTKFKTVEPTTENYVPPFYGIPLMPVFTSAVKHGEKLVEDNIASSAYRTAPNDTPIVDNGQEVALYKYPPGTGLPDQQVGGGYAMDVSDLRPAPLRRNLGLMFFRAFHYANRNLPGRTYSAYQPVYGFSEWLR
jgi:hypothetical protein